MEDPAPRPTKEEALAAVKALVAVPKKVIIEPRCQEGMKKLKMFADDVIDALASATVDQMCTNEPDENPDRFDWIVAFRLPRPRSTRGIYAKVALTRPHLRTGRVIQFKRSRHSL